MSAVRVIPTFDPGKDRQLRFGLRFEAPATQHLTFKSRPKRLGQSVVVTISHRTRGGHHTRFLTPLAKRVACVLTTAIGVMDHTLRSTLRDGILQCFEYKLSTQMILHRPPDHFARVHI